VPFQPVLEPQPLLLVPPLLPPDDQGRPVRFVQARVQEALDLEGEAETACSPLRRAGRPGGQGPADRPARPGAGRPHHFELRVGAATVISIGAQSLARVPVSVHLV
jgi:hypothetical protein